MRLSTTLPALLMSMTLCVTAVAETATRPEQLRPVPPGRTVEFEGTEHKCFSVPEWKEMGHILLDYRALFAAANRMELRLELHFEEVALLEQRTALWLEVTEELKTERHVNRQLFDAEHALRLEAEGRADSWTRNLPWGLVVVESVLIGVLGVWSATSN